MPNGSLLPSIFQLGFGQNLAHFRQQIGQQIGQVRDQLVGVDVVGTDELNIPDMLDVSAVGFDLDQPNQRLQAPSLPTYETPPSPRKGFTRDTKARTSLVCPNCNEELGAGDEVKSRVWIFKACGHVHFP